MRDPLRSLLFTPYRKGYGAKFRLRTFDVGRTDHMGKSIIGYELWKLDGRERTLLFAGEDFACSPLCAIDSDDCVASLMGFLTLKPGDTDEEYFARYTAAQLAYSNTYAEALSGAVIDRFGEA